MIGQTLRHYRILSELGRGGMGVVYKAEDTKLKRPVALKLLPPYLTQDQEAIQRFIYEAQTASSLDHQNLSTIHQIDESDDGRMFICMAYYEGETLKKKVTSDQLSVDSAIDIAIQISQGLAKAHKKGIIHRDLKPSNIIVQEDGTVKIIDFGLSKLLGAQQLTKSGATMGTVAYMSPEQARGQIVDQRTDLWSLGVVLYEMLTGELPFKGELDQAVIYSILDEEPAPITSLRSEVPAEFEWIVNKALAKNPGERYHHAEEMLSELVLLKKKIESGASERLEIGAKPARRKRTYLYVGVVAFIILLIGSGLFLFSERDEAVDSIAVLPFDNATADPETDYLSDGVTESLIYSLSQLPELKVIARSSVFRYKGQALNPQVAARELGVRAVVTGRIVQSDDNLSISAELVDSQDNSLLWGRQYKRNLADLLTIQEELAKEISDRLRPELRREEIEQATKSHTENIEAHQLYLKGRYFWNKRTAEGLKKGVEFFQQAIAIDPNYALAYSGLADCYSMIGVDTGDPPKEYYLKAKAAAMKALRMDETLAEAHASLGYLSLRHEWNWQVAERELKRAIAINPNYATAHQWYAICLEFMGRSDEAVAAAKRSVELDPLSLIINEGYGSRLCLARRYDQALEQLRKTLEIDSSFAAAHASLGAVYVQMGRHEAAIAEFQRARQLHDDPGLLACLGHAYAVLGKRDEAQKFIEELKEQSQRSYVLPDYIAQIYAGLGENDQAFIWLEKAYEEHSDYMIFLRADPVWDNLRSDVRFAALLKKIGSYR